MGTIGRPCNSTYKKLKWVLNPITQAIFWLYTFSIAAYASVYSQEIKAFIMPWQLNAGPVNWFSVSILVLAIIAAIFFSVSIWIRATRSDYLLRAIQTSPPSSFWRHYEDAFIMSWKLKSLAEASLSHEPLSTEHVEEAKKTIRILLDYIINLVQQWDSANLERKVIYRANLMRVIYFEDDPNYEVTEDNKYFMEPVKENYSGIVILEGVEYTTTTETKGSTPDNQRKPIVFPFCLQGNKINQDFQSNLRGAPYCIATANFDYVGDVTSIVKSYESSSPRCDRIFDNLKQYYSRPDNPAHSILSIPLIDADQIGEGQGAGSPLPKVSWVLNIYRNQSEMLYEGMKAKDFVSVASPFTAILLDILSLIDYYSSSAGIHIPKVCGEMDETNRNYQN